ncbi:hypothetical protein [Halanaerobacter jeridensis]|uniref:Uncharacterized protein n=1 Tax=Halanaerobacter jeridensis TaxID=706427 RepID=A0A939BPG0_9FIRM|nr:hypothetical protein [Halanaerobacter jeridensis]MBM7556793.1 hypothetical protein [Halanaerobacter jeridensis]
MQSEKIIKLAVLNLGLAVLEIIFFSEGLLGIQLRGGRAFETALGVTIVVLSFVIFIMGNYKLLFEKEEIINTVNLNTTADYIEALKQNKSKKLFTKDIDNILEQIDRFNNKKETIKDMLLQKFNDDELSYSKFEGTVLDIEHIFYINIKSIINKLNAFDEEDYNFIKSSEAQENYSPKFIKNKRSIYHEYISFIKDSIEDNEVILLKLDKLLLEISRFNSLEDGEIEQMGAMKEIDELIKQTKLFK